MNSVNPVDLEVVQTYPEMPPAEMLRITERIEADQQQWREISIQDRAQHLPDLAKLLRNEIDPLAELITTEMGKPITQSRAEIQKCASLCEYYASSSSDRLKDAFIKTETHRHTVTHEPLGILLAIMPWNFPFWQVFRACIPAIVAGNGIALKHAPNTCGCSLAIEALFNRANFPFNLFRSLIISHENVSHLIEHSTISAVTLTGSTRAGQTVASQAGAAIKKTVLELGGNDPYLILQDADLETAALKCVEGRMLNAGQTCISAKRWIVHASAENEFTERVLSLLQDYTLSDPLNPQSTLGPLARKDLQEMLHDQVSSSKRAGARCLLGGNPPKHKGAWYPATLLNNVAPNMAAFDEELFGPVASIVTATDDEQAVALANHSRYGLGGAVFSEDPEHAWRIAKRIDCGTVAINDFVKSDPRVPFGGIKESGYGRELGEKGLEEFVNTKTYSQPI